MRDFLFRNSRTFFIFTFYCFLPGGCPRILASVSIFSNCRSLAIIALRFEVTPCIFFSKQYLAYMYSAVRLILFSIRYLNKLKQDIGLRT